MNPYRCSEHAQTQAGWSCNDCGKTLCPDCVAGVHVARSEGSYDYEVCVHCNGVVAALTVPGIRESFRDLLRQALVVPVGLATLCVGGAMYLLAAATNKNPPLVIALVWTLVLSPLFWALFFLILKQALRGSDVASGAVSTRAVQDLLLPAVRMAGLSLVAVALGALLSRVGVPAIALVVPFAALFPAWAISLGRGEGLRRALHPRTTLELIRGLGGDFAAAAATSVVVSGFVSLWVARAAYLWMEQLEGIGALLETAALYAGLFIARLVGLLMAARADVVGVELRPDQRLPALPGIAPRGLRKEAPPPPPPPAREALELDLSAPIGPMELSGFVSADPLDAEVAAFRTTPEADARRMQVSALIAIGQRAAAQGQLELAVSALKIAATARPEDPEAPRACVILGRIYRERLGDPGEAEKVFRHVAGRYPGTKAAEFAAAQLSSTG